MVVDTRDALAAGCVFRKTGNDIWLMGQPIPTSAIAAYAPWTLKAEGKGKWKPIEERLRDPTQEEMEAAEQEAAGGPPLLSLISTIRL